MISGTAGQGLHPQLVDKRCHAGRVAGKPGRIASAMSRRGASRPTTSSYMALGALGDRFLAGVTGITQFSV
jgi:hypothetical protein